MLSNAAGTVLLLLFFLVGEIVAADKLVESRCKNCQESTIDCAEACSVGCDITIAKGLIKTVNLVLFHGFEKSKNFESLTL